MELGRHRDHRRPRGGEDVCDLADVVAGVDADDVSAQSRCGELPHQRIGPVRQVHGDALTTPDADGGQLVPQRTDPVGQLPPGDGQYPVPADVVGGRQIRCLPDQRGQHTAQCRVRGGGHEITSAADSTRSAVSHSAACAPKSGISSIG